MTTEQKGVVMSELKGIVTRVLDGCDSEKRKRVVSALRTMHGEGEVRFTKVIRKMYEMAPELVRTTILCVQVENRAKVGLRLRVIRKKDVRENQIGTVVEVTPKLGVRLRFEDGKVEAFKFGSVRVPVPTTSKATPPPPLPPPLPPPPPSTKATSSSQTGKKRVRFEEDNPFMDGFAYGVRTEKIRRTEAFAAIRSSIGKISSSIDDATTPLEMQVKLDTLLMVLEE